MSAARRLYILLVIVLLLVVASPGWNEYPAAQAQTPVQFDDGIDPAVWYRDHEIEHAWRPDYVRLATGDPNTSAHGVYAWPFALDSIGWSMPSYQNYGGTPYFHHGMDMMKMYGTNVFNRSGGQVINIENYQPGWDLYWEVAVLDPDGYIWQYHHIDQPTIPQYIWDKFAEYQADPVNGGFIPPDTYIGDIIYWPVWSFGKQFNHIHLNILGAGGVYINGFEFHTPLPDTDGPQIQAIGLLKNGQIYPGNVIDGSYSLYVRARDLILDDVYYLPPFEIAFAVDGGPEQTTWRFDTLPGGADRYAYLNDFYVPPTCGNYSCRDYYMDLGFIPDSQFEFPCSGGEHTVMATVRDYAGNSASQLYTYTVVNYAPAAYSQSVSTDEDMSLDIVLTGSDPNCDVLTFSVTAGPAHGTLGGAAPNLVYTPAANYAGADAFTFVISDGLAVSNPAVVSIDVLAINDAPLAAGDNYTTAVDAPLGVSAPGVLGNDSDPDGDALTAALYSGPSQGMLTLSADGSFVYTPTLGWSGVDSFVYAASDGALTGAAAVWITVASASYQYQALVQPYLQSVYAIAVVPIVITNTGNLADTYALSFGGNVWDAFLSDADVALEPGDSAAIFLTVEFPPDAAPYATDTLDLTVTPQAGALFTATLTVDTACRFDFDGNDMVEVTDLVIMLGELGGDNPRFDVNHEGAVDITDMVVVLGRFGVACP